MTDKPPATPPKDSKVVKAGKPAPVAISERLNVKVFSPFQVFYQGEAVSVSATNKTGPFDVLFNHANFFSLLVSCEVVVTTPFQQFKFPLERGIIKVHQNQVMLFADV